MAVLVYGRFGCSPKETHVGSGHCISKAYNQLIIRSIRHTVNSSQSQVINLSVDLSQTKEQSN